MKRPILTLCLLTIGSFVYGQSNSIGIYPVNTLWLFSSSFRPSIQVKASKSQDWLAFSWIKGMTGDYYFGGEDGFQVDYRIQLNRDTNVEFKSNTFIGMYFSRVRNDMEDLYSSPYRKTGFGITMGNYFQLTEHLMLEAYLGLGRSSEKPENGQFSFSSGEVTGGLNFGIIL